MGSKPFYRRRFLNRRGHHAGAFVLAECSVDSKGDRTVLEAYVTIADCGRIVTLDFSGSTKSELGNALSKARTLRVVMADLASALEDASREVLEARSGGP